MRKLLIAFLLIISFNVYALDRIALVIGNAEYLVKPLNNSVNDAKDISRYCYVRKIIELFELDCKVKKAPENTFRRRAPVSNNESAINYKLDLLKINCMGSWDEALQRYIDTLKKSI